MRVAGDGHDNGAERGAQDARRAAGETRDAMVRRPLSGLNAAESTP
jgi:hypothetical protein